MYLYLVLELITLLVPGLFLFSRKLGFYHKAYAVLISLIVVAIPFTIVDVIFTAHGVWGFNPSYCIGIFWLGLPLEEWLFFIVIPFASLFLHDTLVYLFPRFRITTPYFSYWVILLTIFLLGLALSHSQNQYTRLCFIFTPVVILYSYLEAREDLERFFCTFLIIVIPFLVVNGILTGTFLKEPIVWYRNTDILGIRILTIPVEDFAYAFSLILLNLLVSKKLHRTFTSLTRLKNGSDD